MASSDFARYRAELRRVTRNRVEDTLDMVQMNSSSLTPVDEILVQTCEAVKGLLTTWPEDGVSAEAGELESLSGVVTGLKARLDKKERPPKRTATDSLVLVLADAVQQLADQWPSLIADVSLSQRSNGNASIPSIQPKKEETQENKSQEKEEYCGSSIRNKSQETHPKTNEVNMKTTERKHLNDEAIRGRHLKETIASVASNSTVASHCREHDSVLDESSRPLVPEREHSTSTVSSAKRVSGKLYLADQPLPKCSEHGMASPTGSQTPSSGSPQTERRRFRGCNGKPPVKPDELPAPPPLATPSTVQSSLSGDGVSDEEDVDEDEEEEDAEEDTTSFLYSPDKKRQRVRRTSDRIPREDRWSFKCFYSEKKAEIEKMNPNLPSSEKHRRIREYWNLMSDKSAYREKAALICGKVDSTPSSPSSHNTLRRRRSTEDDPPFRARGRPSKAQGSKIASTSKQGVQSPLKKKHTRKRSPPLAFSKRTPSQTSARTYQLKVAFWQSLREEISKKHPEMQYDAKRGVAFKMWAGFTEEEKAAEEAKLISLGLWNAKAGRAAASSTEKLKDKVEVNKKKGKIEEKDQKKKEKDEENKKERETKTKVVKQEKEEEADKEKEIEREMEMNKERDEKMEEEVTEELKEVVKEELDLDKEKEEDKEKKKHEEKEKEEENNDMGKSEEKEKEKEVERNEEKAARNEKSPTRPKRGRPPKKPPVSVETREGTVTTSSSTVEGATIAVEKITVAAEGTAAASVASRSSIDSDTTEAAKCLLDLSSMSQPKRSGTSSRSSPSDSNREPSRRAVKRPRWMQDMEMNYCEDENAQRREEDEEEIVVYKSDKKA